MVDGVSVVHAIHHHLASLLQPLVGSHARNCVPLHHDVTPREQLQRLQSGAVGSKQALASLGESVLVRHLASDFDDVRLHLIVQNLEGLRCWHAPGKQFNQIPCFDDDVWIPSLYRRSHRHGAFHQVEFAAYSVFFQSSSNGRPHLLQIALTVFGKQSCKGALLQHSTRVIFLGHFLIRPVVNASVVPRLITAILVVFVRIRVRLWLRIRIVEYTIILSIRVLALLDHCPLSLFEQRG
mmetsp:Transcript_24850/g.47145  ORF Transcript_24850/g.47145 Transcript_24850/m.47145 type:complete len:238 (-) Transcript_24850:207-920(-)